MALSFGPMLVLVNSTPDRIPADIIAEEQAREEEKGVSQVTPKSV